MDGMRVDFQKACQVVHLLCEGMGIRAISRFTGLDTKTVMSILEMAGGKAAAFLDAQVRNVNAALVQVDELVSFVGIKQANAPDGSEEFGQFFTYLSVDRASKLIINCHTSKRTKDDTESFLHSLKRRVEAPFQLTTDGWIGYAGYNGMVRRVFGETIDYATEIKRFASHNASFTVRYQRPKLLSIKKRVRIGNPDLKMATTCHCERTNLSVRLFNRRFTRLTLGYSKKLENLRHAVALFVWHFNFCRVHSAHGKTPAQAAGLTNRVLKIEELFNPETQKATINFQQTNPT